MPRMENNGGDSLARGAVRATFRPMGEKLSREQWAERTSDEVVKIQRAVYIFNCPNHGEFVSERVCYITGGYPQYDTYTKSKCVVDECEEKCPTSAYSLIEEEESAT